MSDASDRPRVAWRPRLLDPRVASTRIRCLRPMETLRSRGWQVEIFDPRRSGEYDIIVYAKRYDSDSFREAERLRRKGASVVLDLCDNHFYNPHRLPALASAREMIARMVGVSDVVVTSTPALAEVLKQHVEVSAPLRIIGDAVETEFAPSLVPAWRRPWDRYRASRLQAWTTARRAESRTLLVWFGIHGGPSAEHGMIDLLKIRRRLESLDSRCPLSLTVVSNSRHKYRRLISDWALPTRYIEWSPVHFRSTLALHDIAVIPITPNPFTLVKSNNRLALALSCGVAVAADRIPSYEEWSDVCLLDDWEKLEGYIRNSERREQDVRIGSERVHREWSMDRIADRWERLFLSLASARHSEDECEISSNGSMSRSGPTIVPG